mgnify:FL=1
MKTITVLDYESGKVTQYNVDKWKIDTEDIQSFLFLNDHNVSNCHWMVHEDATIYVK